MLLFELTRSDVFVGECIIIGALLHEKFMVVPIFMANCMVLPFSALKVSYT